MPDQWVVTQVELRTVWERRRVEHRFERREPGGPAREAPSAFDPWGEALDVPTDGRDGLVEKVRNDLGELVRCPCVTSGQPDADGVTCRICDGTRVVAAHPVAVAETGTARWLRCVEPKDRRGLPTPIVIHLAGTAVAGKVVVKREGRKFTVGDPPEPWTGADLYGPPVATGRVAWMSLALVSFAGAVGYFYCHAGGH